MLAKAKTAPLVSPCGAPASPRPCGGAGGVLSRQLTHLLGDGRGGLAVWCGLLMRKCCRSLLASLSHSDFPSLRARLIPFLTS